MSCRFEREVSKWDESGNDIVVLAKEMCVMMMDMSDFTRYIRLAKIIENDHFDQSLCAVILLALTIGIHTLTVLQTFFWRNLSQFPALH